MSKTTDEHKATDEQFLADLLPPLAKRTRTEEVTRQLAALGRLSRTQALRRVSETDPARRLARETLVALIRAARRAGDTEAGGQVLNCLLRRLRPAIQARVRAWRTLAAADAEDAESAAVAALVGYLVSSAPSEELWECNFVGCFDFRMITILKAATVRRVATVSATAESEGGEAQDLLASLPDPAALAEFADIEMREKIAGLSRDNPLLGEYLYLTLAGFSDTEIAARMGVTARTLRNWKTRLRAAFAREE